jgi:rRNA maturation RNase YbeY
MRLQIDNRQCKFRVRRPALRQVALALARLAAAARGARPWREVTLILVDDAGIEPLNRAILRHKGATDVITQRYAPMPGEPDGVIGEVFVNMERAWQVAGSRRSWPPSRELALYIAHGFDHLNDADDSTPAARRRMRQRELRWLGCVRVLEMATRRCATVRRRA